MRKHAVHDSKKAGPRREGGGHAPLAHVPEKRALTQARVDTGFPIRTCATQNEVEPISIPLEYALEHEGACRQRVGSSAKRSARAMALRRKRRASILVAMETLRRGDAEAVVSAGNTGAAMAAALLILGRIEGIDRPAIAAVLPTLRGRAIMVDVGANVDCRPKHLLQFAVMGSVYAQRVLGVARPRVGLMSNGTEETKGNELVIRAADLLRESGLHFIGNVEGREFFDGTADVVVCDGFVGNLLLKFGEGLAVGIFTLLREELSRGLLVRLGVALATPRLRALARRMDYTEYGGAPLLGVNGICIITHGSSGAKAMRNSIALAAESVRSRMVETIRDDIAYLSPIRSVLRSPQRDTRGGPAEVPLPQGSPVDL